MDILYLTLSDPDIHSTGIYADLVNALADKGHAVTIVYADDPTVTVKTYLKNEGRNIEMLRVRCGRVFGVNFIIKGINTLRVEPLLRQAIRKYLADRHYDLVIYATPPVTFANVIRFCKKKYGCKSLLMLKDIFPQNAVDLGLIGNGGPIHLFFRNKEKSLYELSDKIGCMSEKNVEYVTSHNSKETAGKCFIFPNTIDVKKAKKPLEHEKSDDVVRFVFGGNLGKPQAIDFLLKAISSERIRNNKKLSFMFIGNGSETEKVRSAAAGLENMEFKGFLPPDEYNAIMNNCDVGLISLDSRFTIPNYPSRTLGYMSMGKPILALTDRNTDIKELIEDEAKCGKWCASDDIEAFAEACEWFLEHISDLKGLGQNGYDYLVKNFDVSRSVELIEKCWR